eukprot:gnl/TRDRNA2_/TRDRNA2_91693_c0_seq1.p1 gnl/TRDRNA2_/TRDRNA2_91693_c0~~gnl/TRDRNA2_/TRDRNA2_91693_c0_seq1.p1  ORF type:complete len:271 (-),score=27.34 gnl/TRDRNA2_/TRDRNA2_91693_c0_seq1:133-945(-)
MAATASSTDADPERQPLVRKESSRLSQAGYKRQLTHFAVPKSESHEELYGICDSTVRAEFITKVYALLSAEIAYSVVVCSMFIFWKPLRDGAVAFVRNYTLTYQILIIASMIVSLVALMIYKNEHPSNMWLLLLFLTVMSCVIGVPCAIMATQGKSPFILMALITTCLIFLVLTAYVHWSKQDFSYLDGFLICALFGNILLGIFAVILGIPALIWAYHCFGIMIFCGFILYDTSQIIHTYGCDDYLVASIELYLDFVNLFLHMLALLGDN